MSRPQVSWGHAEWLGYFRDSMTRSVETDIRSLLTTQGAFGVPRQFFPHVEYLSGLVFGPSGGHGEPPRPLPRGSQIPLLGLLGDFDAIAGLQFGILLGGRLDLRDCVVVRDEAALGAFG